MNDPATFTIDSPTFKIDELRYVTVPTGVHIDRDLIPTVQQPALLTVLSARSTDPPDPQRIRKQLFELHQDDVWDFGFWPGIFINTGTSALDLSSVVGKAVRDELHQIQSWCLFYANLGCDDGPYLLQDSQMHSALRLYDDTAGAFMVPTKEVSSGVFEPLRLMGHRQQCLGVAVPTKPTSSRTNWLSGKRIAVKEAFEIKGIAAALGNRAFEELATPAAKTAPAIEKLLKLGVKLVGTTKTSSMISREDGVEAVDYQAPWNPRADQYQSPTGSSSGSAAAIASYEWLDFTIGTDTTGSSRRPAFVNGCFQIRLSQDSLPLEGILPCFPFFDAIAIFSRRIDELHEFTKAWLWKDGATKANDEVSTLKPTRIVWIKEYFPVRSAEQMAMIQQSLNEMNACFNVPVDHVSLEELWASTTPQAAQGQTLKAYLKDAGRNSFVHDFYHRHDDFRGTYRKKHGREPFVNKVTQWRWDVGSKISKEERDEAIEKMLVYRKWLLDHVLRTESENSLVILPVADAVPTYRDADPGPPFAQEVWDLLWMSPVLAAPEVTAPIGTMKYHSRISGVEENLPVGVSWLAAPGMDLMLLRAVRDAFEFAGRPLGVEVGREMYSNEK